MIKYNCAKLFLILFTLTFQLLLFSSSVLSASEAELWRSLSNKNHFAIMRHALAPGTGDPAIFTLRDCSTQRNLSAQGRSQAEKIGEMFRQNNISEAAIYSSQWCRCLETARLLSLGPVQEFEPLNSFFQNFENEEKQTRELRMWLENKELDMPHILVTHQVNITAFTGIFPSSGEMVVMRKDGAGKYTVLGTINTGF